MSILGSEHNKKAWARGAKQKQICGTESNQMDFQPINPNNGHYLSKNKIMDLGDIDVHFDTNKKMTHNEINCQERFM